MKYVPLCSTIHPLLGKTKNHGLSTSMLMKTTGLNPYPNLMVEHIVPNIKATKEKHQEWIYPIYRGDTVFALM